MPGEFRERRFGHCYVIHIDPSHDAGNETAICGEIEQETGLIGRRRRLHQNSPGDAALGEQRFQIVRRVIPVQGSQVGREPTVVAPVGSPEMLVGIDAMVV